MRKGMRRHKLAAFTLMEITVAMLVAAIALAITYTAYRLVSASYLGYVRKNGLINEYLAADKAIRREVMSAGLIRQGDGGFTIVTPQDTLHYRNENGLLLRSTRNRTDTLKLDLQDIRLTFEGAEIQPGDIADRIELRTVLEKVPVTTVYTKNYSAADLYTSP
jgi:type II secretory pathway component PulJ